MSSIKTITSAMAGVFALTTMVSAETTVTLPDVNASIYGKLNYSAYYNEDTSGNGTWTSSNNASRIGLSISEVGDIGAFGKLEVGVDMDDAGTDTFSSRLAYFGIDSAIGTVSIGRQNSVFTGVLERLTCLKCTDQMQTTTKVVDYLILRYGQMQ